MKTKNMTKKIDEREGLPSASSMDANMRCMGRHLASIGIETKQSVVAKRGSDIHEVLAGTKEMETLSDSDKMTTQRIMNEEAFYVDKYDKHTAKVQREIRLWYPDAAGNGLYSGQLDCLYVDGGIGLLIDYKTGWGSTVPIERNWQIKTQAVLAWFTKNLKTVHCVLIHPHHPETLSEYIRYDEKQLEGFCKTIEGYCLEWKTEQQRTPNLISCQYCPFKTKCPEYKTQLDSFVKKESITAQEKGDRLDYFKVIEDIIDTERETYKLLLAQDPSLVAGWKLQAGTTTSISDHAKAIEILISKGGLDASMVSSVVEISMTKLTEAVSSTTKQTKKDARVTVENLLASVLVKKSSSPKLVKIS